MSQLITQTDNDRISIQTSNNNFDIRLSKTDDIIELYISDYISLPEYIERIKLIDVLGADRLLSNFLLWNTERQKVNKGTFYIIEKEDIVYNILINQDEVMIDESCLIEDGKREKIIKVDIATGEYTYSILKHDKIGSTFLEYCFSSIDDDFYSSEEECSKEIKKILSNIEDINLFDISLLKKALPNDNIKVKKQ